MNANILLFAAADAFAAQVKEATQSGGFNTRDILIATSIGLGVGAVLFIWAYFRYRKKEVVKAPRVEPKRVPAPPDSENEDGPSERRRRRKRRRRRDHRPRNPTLQQTGGLPPPRPDDQLPKY